MAPAANQNQASQPANLAVAAARVIFSSTANMKAFELSRPTLCLMCLFRLHGLPYSRGLPWPSVSSSARATIVAPASAAGCVY